jgi:hypothetical protein
MAEAVKDMSMWSQKYNVSNQIALQPLTASAITVFLCCYLPQHGHVEAKTG